MAFDFLLSLWEVEQVSQKGSNPSVWGASEDW